MKPLLCLLAALSLQSCNLLEGLHQTSPGYNTPVPFSTPWWDKHKSKQP